MPVFRFGNSPSRPFIASPPLQKKKNSENSRKIENNP
jgi:hypothetical protein